MINNYPSEDMESLWQSQAAEPLKLCPEDFQQKMRAFERKIFQRNAREYVACAVVIASFGYYEWRFHELVIRVASALIIAGALYVMFQIHRRASPQTVPADLGMSTCIDFYRTSLERQRDALRTVWTWYLLPFVPGLAVFLLGSIMNQWAAHSGGLGHFVIGFLSLPGITIAVYFVVWKLNRLSAQRLQAEIDELNALRDSPR